MLKLWRSSFRIVLRERVRSPISSPPPGGSGASKRPAAICSAALARRRIRIAISEEARKPTSTPIAVAISNARRRSPWSSSNAWVSEGGGSALTITAPRTGTFVSPKIGAAAIVTLSGRLAS